MIIGVTSSRRGLTHEQVLRAYRLLEFGLELTGTNELHHGDCVGGDEQLAAMAAALGYRTVAHPPSNPTLRAWHASSVVLAAKPYLQRNRDIVDAAAGEGMVLACPSEPAEQLRSGTWATIRYARTAIVKLHVIGPNGARLS